MLKFNTKDSTKITAQQLRYGMVVEGYLGHFQTFMMESFTKKG